jgi:hypothetical protein
MPDIGLKDAMVAILRKILLIGLDGIAHVNRRHPRSCGQKDLREASRAAADLEDVHPLINVQPLPAVRSNAALGAVTRERGPGM